MLSGRGEAEEALPVGQVEVVLLRYLEQVEV
jgi:hypothetical protein